MLVAHNAHGGRWLVAPSGYTWRRAGRCFAVNPRDPIHPIGGDRCRALRRIDHVAIRRLALPLALALALALSLLALALTLTLTLVLTLTLALKPASLALALALTLTLALTLARATCRATCRALALTRRTVCAASTPSGDVLATREAAGADVGALATGRQRGRQRRWRVGAGGRMRRRRG